MATIYLTVDGNWAFPSSIILGVSEAPEEEGRKKKTKKERENLDILDLQMWGDGDLSELPGARKKRSCMFVQRQMTAAAAAAP
jgi:hypothetical protein